MNVLWSINFSNKSNHSITVDSDACICHDYFAWRGYYMSMWLYVNVEVCLMICYKMLNEFDDIQGVINRNGSRSVE